MASTMVVPPSKHTLFMRGFTTRQNVDKIRDFFTREAGNCTVEFFKESENREKLFVALRFDTKEVAKDILNRFDQVDVLGDRITVSWFKDLRRARQKAAQQGQNVFHGRGWADDRGRHQSQRNVSLRNGFRPGQYKGHNRNFDNYNSQGDRWQRQNSGGRPKGRRPYERERSSSRSRSRSRSSSRTYSRSRSRSPKSASRERSRERGTHAKSRSRSYSPSPDSRRTPSPYIPGRHARDRGADRGESSDRSPRPKSTDRANGVSQRWDDSKNAEGFNKAGGDGARNTNGSHEQEGRDNFDQDSSPPRNRHLRSAVTTVEREDGYEQEDEYSTEDRSRRHTSSAIPGGQVAAAPVIPASSAHPASATAANHVADPSPVRREYAAAPREREADKAHSRSRSRDYDSLYDRSVDRSGDRSYGGEAGQNDRYSSHVADGVGNEEVSHAHEADLHTGRSQSPDSRSERSQADQDQYEDRKRERKRTVSGDDAVRYEDETKRGRFVEEEKVDKPKRAMAKRTRGAEHMEEDMEDRDLPDRGALGLPHDKMIMVREKKEEIEKAYRQDCETFAAVVKMLVSKDSDLESKLQQSLRENLKEIGQRCIQELREFINKVRTEEQL